MELIEEKEARERSPNHTWTPDSGTIWKHRVQWRSDKRRSCAVQSLAAWEARHAINQTRQFK